MKWLLPVLLSAPLLQSNASFCTDQQCCEQCCNLLVQVDDTVSEQDCASGCALDCTGVVDDVACNAGLIFIENSDTPAPVNDIFACCLVSDLGGNEAVLITSDVEEGFCSITPTTAPSSAPTNLPTPSPTDEIVTDAPTFFPTDSPTTFSPPGNDDDFPTAAVASSAAVVAVFLVVVACGCFCRPKKAVDEEDQEKEDEKERKEEVKEKVEDGEENQRLKSGNPDEVTLDSFIKVGATPTDLLEEDKVEKAKFAAPRNNPNEVEKGRSSSRISGSYLDFVLQNPLRMSIFRPSSMYIDRQKKKREKKATQKAPPQVKSVLKDGKDKELSDADL